MANNKEINEAIQDILSEGWTLVNDYNGYKIQSTRYGDKDFTVNTWDDSKFKEFDDIYLAIKYANKKK